MHVIAQLHEQGDSAGAVVGSHETPARILPIPIGKGSRVVMTGDQHALGHFGMPGDDQVRHPHRGAADRVGRIERLVTNLGSELGEMLGEHGLLFAHPPAAAGPPADSTDLLQITVGSGASSRWSRGLIFRRIATVSRADDKPGTNRRMPFPSLRQPGTAFVPTTSPPVRGRIACSVILAGAGALAPTAATWRNIDRAF